MIHFSDLYYHEETFSFIEDADDYAFFVAGAVIFFTLMWEKKRQSSNFDKDIGFVSVSNPEKKNSPQKL